LVVLRHAVAQDKLKRLLPPLGAPRCGGIIGQCGFV
jgi:hypothetical protein